MWFWVALLGYFLLAVVVLLDKIILTKSVPKPAVYTFFSTVFLLALFAGLPFTDGLLNGLDWYWALGSGVTFGLSLWTMFLAMKHGEASHMGPFIGAFITIFSFVLGAILLGESLTVLQRVGVGVLILASFLLSNEKTRKGSGFHIGFFWAIVSGFLFGLSHVLAKHIYDIYPFLTGLIWTKGTTGIFGLMLLLAPSVRKALVPKRKAKSKREREKQETRRFKAIALVVSNKVLSVVSNLLIQYAIAIGSVTLVNAMGGLQYAFLFVMVVVMSKWFRKYFQEYFTKKELQTQTIAVLLIVIGAALFVF